MKKLLGKRGRPVGFELSEESRRAISRSKTGQKHKQETKDRISRSLLLYFRHKNPISKEISNSYYRILDSTMRKWFYGVESELDLTPNLLTDKALRNKGKIEISCGNDIEYFSHEITPELILLFKEYCEINDLDPEDVLEGLA